MSLHVNGKWPASFLDSARFNQSAVCIMTSPGERLAQFRQDGYTVFEAVHAPELISKWRAVYDDICRRQGETVWLGSAFEVDPDLFLPAIANARLLDFAEQVMGPFVQMDDLSINAFPSVPVETAPAATAWHRDRYSEVPQTGDYVHPLACNTIFYLHDLNPARGPLRVLPGSHRQPIVFTPEDRQASRPGERLLSPKAGDVVFTHGLLAHSGTPNTSGAPRYFMAASYNRSWMRHRMDLDGPRTAALRERAIAAGDRRLARLLGHDAQLWDRVNPYWFMGLDEARWQAWIEEDRQALQGGAAHANSALVAKPGATRTVSGTTLAG